MRVREASDPNGLAVMAQRLVRSLAELEIVPDDALVETAEHDVVAHRVHVEAGQPAYAWLQRLNQGLGDEIVYADLTLRGDEKVRSRRVKGDLLDVALEPLERSLSLMARQLVDQDRMPIACPGQNG